MSVLSILVGLFIVHTEVTKAKKAQHIIICEQGLLQVGNEPLSQEFDMVFWLDVLSIKKSFRISFSAYIITGRKDVLFFLDTKYQDIKELVEVIKQRSGIA